MTRVERRGGGREWRVAAGSNGNGAQLGAQLSLVLRDGDMHGMAMQRLIRSPRSVPTPRTDATLTTSVLAPLRPDLKASDAPRPVALPTPPHSQELDAEPDTETPSQTFAPPRHEGHREVELDPDGFQPATMARQHGTGE